MDLAGLDAEHVAFVVEVADLAPTVGEEMGGARRPPHQTIDEVRLLVLGVDFLATTKGEAGSPFPGSTGGQGQEVVGGVEQGRHVESPCC